MNDNLKRVARTGFAAKGITYAIAGVLTFMAACNMGGGEEAGKMQVLKFLEEQPFGNFLLIIMSCGLAAYAIWRLFESISDPEHIGTDAKAIVKRIGYFISGLLYLGIAGMAILRGLGSSDSGGGSDSAQNSPFLASTTGVVILGIVAAVVIIIGMVRFVQAFKKDYTEDLDFSAIKNRVRRKLVEVASTFGYAARGFIYVIIGFFGVKAAVTSNPSEIKSTSDAFSFLHQSEYGKILLASVAAGLMAHAIYMFILAKYRRFRA